MSLGLGDINASVLQGLVTSLGAIIDKVGPEEAAVLQSSMDHFNTIGTALESKTMADLLSDAKALEDPLLARLDKLIEFVEPFAGFSNGFTVTASFMPKTVGVTPALQPAANS